MILRYLKKNLTIIYVPYLAQFIDALLKDRKEERNMNEWISVRNVSYIVLLQIKK